MSNTGKKKESIKVKGSTKKYILGINSAYHEPAACLIKDGQIIAAVEEERFNRIRHGKSARIDNPDQLPIESIKFCLKEANICARDIDYIGFSFNPEKRLANNVGIEEDVNPNDWGSKEGELLFYNLLKGIPKKLSELLGEDLIPKFRWIDHHLCHAASCYFVSPFKDAAILSTDGIGEFASIWLGYGRGNKIKTIRETGYPNSIGFLWTKVSRFLGFMVSGYGEYGAGRVMSLGAFGDPNRYYKKFREFVDFNSNGYFKVDKNYLQFRSDDCSKFEELFGKARKPNEDIEERHQDIAAALQKTTNEILLCLTEYLYKKTKTKNICRAGGVALNCISNSLLHKCGLFENTYIQPGANDMGTAIGAAYYIWNHMLENKKAYIMNHPYLGPEFPDEKIEETLRKNRLSFIKLKDIEKVAARLIADGNIVAWFQGKMEFGPRALGNRSILVDPRRFDMVAVLNENVKNREYFRPFASSVLEKKAKEWFEIDKDTVSYRFMLFSHKVRQDKIGKIPGVIHIDGTSRIQTVNKETNPKFFKLIGEFEKLTGIPLVLNTSFNDREPIVCKPEDAVATCLRSNVDYLIIGDYIVDTEHNNYNVCLLSELNQFSEIIDFLLRIQTDIDFRKSILENPEVNLGRYQGSKRVKMFLQNLTEKIKKRIELYKREFALSPNSTKIKDYITSRR